MTAPADPPEAPDDWSRLGDVVKGAVDQALDDRIKAAEEADKADEKAPADTAPKSRGDGFLARTFFGAK